MWIWSMLSVYIISVKRVLELRQGWIVSYRLSVCNIIFWNVCRCGSGPLCLCSHKSVKSLKLNVTVVARVDVDLVHAVWLHIISV
jgi:hypothetical protein